MPYNKLLVTEIRMHTALWTQIPFIPAVKLYELGSPPLVEEKHLVIVEAEWFSGLKTKQSLQSIRGYFTFC